MRSTLNDEGPISGTVTDANGSPLVGVTLTLSGASAGTTISGPSGTYTFSGLAAGSYTVAPSAIGINFAPNITSLTLLGTGGAANFSASSYTSTPLISAYASTLHAQSVSNFPATAQAIGNAASVSGCGGNELVAVSNAYRSAVQGFVNSVLAFVQTKKQTLPIEASAVTAIFLTYATQDKGYAAGVVPTFFCLTLPGAVAAVIGPLQTDIDSIYQLAILQIP